MSEKDNFGGGFLLGTIIGGVIGGVIGTIITNKANENKNDWTQDSDIKTSKYSTFDDEEIEHSRITLEEKINQLNNAIDEVKVTLMKNSEKEIIKN
ncbi:hypothetical protein [Geminocystis sp. NIES-3709]|uniref:hypothetical protein n=1 Tax=Geminocystis sp. NIES-3709 TaxID=1617448 RepID=UPI0005FC841F|nr:hypothetical protein [Geminocystis sp. NIES-3709]BAQ66897.1 hypothetical protein GM3709_3662 [Geminocystis sp. NIES-3709]